MNSFESGIVFVGENFHRLMFDEGTLFQSSRDLAEDAINGPLAQFSYGSGAYKFMVVPDRVSVVHTGDSMLSEDLYRAGTNVAESIQKHQQPHEARGLGINVQARLTQAVEGPSGTDFCRQLMDLCKMERLTGSKDGHAFVNLAYYRGGVQYTLRLEPEVATSGTNLFMQVNAHQGTPQQEDLLAKVGLFQEIKTYLTGLHERIATEFGGRP